MSAISLISLFGFSLLSLLSLPIAISLIHALFFEDRLFHVKLTGIGGLAEPLSHCVSNITAKLLDFSAAPYPEGMRGGRVNTNIWLLGVGISLIKRRKPR